MRFWAKSRMYGWTGVERIFLRMLWLLKIPKSAFIKTQFSQKRDPCPHPPKSAIWSIMVIEGVTQLREPSGVSRLSPWGELSTGAEGRVSRSVWSNNNNQRILELERVGSKVKTFLASNFQSLMRPKATLVWPCKSMADQQDQKKCKNSFLTLSILFSYYRCYHRQHKFSWVCGEQLIK